MNDAQFARLPGYARREIELLRRALANRESELDALSGPVEDAITDTLVGVRGTLDFRPLPNGSNIRFRMPVPGEAMEQGDRFYIDASTSTDKSGGLLQVTSSHLLSVEPRGANYVWLKVRGHGTR